jgi:predicted ester cyclase
VKGFDPKWRDPPDYIIGITKEIWEDRGVHTLRHRYSDDIPVRSPAALVLGNRAVIAATLSTLAEFPDRALFGEDVIWSPHGEGFLSSHRLLSTATHAGDGAYGRATGARLRYRIIADCYALGDRIVDEWLIRDQGAIVRQMGLDPRSWAAERIALEGGPERCQRPFTPEQDVAGPYDGRGDDHPVGREHAGILSRIMEGDLRCIPEIYDRAATLEGPGGLTHASWPAIDHFWLSLRASFPNAEFRIHHQIGREDARMPPRSALRWSLDGRHEGFGAFGEPTGARVHVMGMSHAEFGPRGLRREWVLFDETAIWKQILLHTG